ncbi:phosphopantetheine-binding protein [Flavobacteriaceae bacterium F89]|uniref:Phosphopantetheine-binding protein n=1 Tax=Cerina litoralis TaxID=2874477 RepID=A0AAE3JT54_9FLAO|nr:phosphopantetheine-binding protein [Cerina litoralis]MCG2461192.1 phosphopantetheine-binding protein [Cerina litoralis]
MENFEVSIAEILEVDNIQLSDELESFDAWDSLTILSIIAHCDDKYKVALSANEISESKSIRGLKELILSKK